MAGAPARPLERYYRLIVETAREGIWFVDALGRTIYANARMAEMLATTPEEMVDRSILDFVPPGDHAATLARLEARRQGASDAAEATLVGRDGREVVVISHGSPIVEDGVFHGVLALVTDITERKRADAALRESEERFRAVFDNTLAGIVVFDDARRFLAANPAALALLGVGPEELERRRLDEFLAAPARAELPGEWRAFLREGRDAGEHELVRPDGRVRLAQYTASAHVQPGRHVVVLQDVTERRRLEARLASAERLEAIGKLASGVAHDFNNQLTAITLACTLALDRIPERSPARGDVEEALRSAADAAALTRQLLAFARRQVLQAQLVDVNDVVRRSEPILRRLLGGDVELRTNLAPALPPILADPTQIHQVLVNLVVNAQDALPEGGAVRIATTTRRLTRGDPDAPRTGVPPRCVQLTVADTGVGIPQDVQEHIFEPFFTTKPVGVGTGLGLSTAYGIVKQSGGFIWVDSAPGRGTLFTVCFPAVEDAARAA